MKLDDRSEALVMVHNVLYINQKFVFLLWFGKGSETGYDDANGLLLQMAAQGYNQKLKVGSEYCNLYMKIMISTLSSHKNLCCMLILAAEENKLALLGCEANTTI